MTDKKKMQDKRIWARMGVELTALRELIMDILEDQDYWDIMDSKTWDRLRKALGHVDTVRREAGSRMNRCLLYLW